MNCDATLVLYVQAYEECRRFYKDTIGLELGFEQEGLSCFHWGAALLMIEQDDEQGAPIAIQPACIRFVVDDVEAEANRLRERGVSIEVAKHTWGTIAKFADPAGNLCALKDRHMTQQQLLGGRKN